MAEVDRGSWDSMNRTLGRVAGTSVLLDAADATKRVVSQTRSVR